jgi:hypothetical protein
MSKFKKTKKILSLNSDDDENNSPILKDKKYSSFLIKMLQSQSNNNKKFIKRLSSNNINLFKQKGNKSTSKVNYTERIRNNDLNLLNKNYSSYKRDTSYNPNKVLKTNNISYNKNNMSPNKSQNKNNNYKTLKIYNYNHKSNHNSPNKKDKEKKKEVSKDKGKLILDKLYGYNKKYIFSKSNILKKKHLMELDKYQNNILKISQRKLSRDNLIKLYTELQTIKTDAEMIKPLPPINYPALIIHSFKEVDYKQKHIPMISFNNKRLDEMDDYEKELYTIKKSNGFKRAKNVKNKRLYKILEILPEHVADIIFRNKNKNI